MIEHGHSKHFRQSEEYDATTYVESDEMSLTQKHPFAAMTLWACRKNVEEPDPEQVRKDLERLEMIKLKRSAHASCWEF